MIAKIFNNINWYALMQATLLTLLILIGVPVLVATIITVGLWMIEQYPILLSIIIMGSSVIGLIKIIYDKVK